MIMTTTMMMMMMMMIVNSIKYGRYDYTVLKFELSLCVLRSILRNISVTAVKVKYEASRPYNLLGRQYCQSLSRRFLHAPLPATPPISVFRILFSAKPVLVHPCIYGNSEIQITLVVSLWLL